MAWEKPAPELIDILDGALLGCGCERRMMFGSPAYFVNGNMFSGVHQRSMILRLSADDRVSLAEEYDEAGPFEPMEGRPMKEYMVLPEAVYRDAEVLGEWLSRGRDYTASLPPKEKKPKSKESV